MIKGNKMTRKFGVQSFGVLAPIIREGDDIARITASTVVDAVSYSGIEDGDIIGITESVVARAEGNYVTIDEAAEDIKKVLGNPKIILLSYPIYSRNRFAMILKAFARAAKKEVWIKMAPVDDVGNKLHKHPFTGLNYDEYYRSIVEGEGKKCRIFSDDRDYGRRTRKSPIPDGVVNCELLHCNPDDEFLKRFCAHTLIDFCKDKCDWGLLGSNKASEEKLKLFPSKKFAQQVVEDVASLIYGWTGKKVEVMVYGDGCFKDPVCGIWEFADPVVSPAYTKGLEGTPNEVKLKNLADEKFADLNGKELDEAIKNEIKNKETNLKGSMASQGTTPRRLTDLLGSLMDLTSGSGDKGTPIVYIKGYFNNYATESKINSTIYEKVKKLLNPISEKI